MVTKAQTAKFLQYLTRVMNTQNPGVRSSLKRINKVSSQRKKVSADRKLSLNNIQNFNDANLQWVRYGATITIPSSNSKYIRYLSAISSFLGTLTTYAPGSKIKLSQYKQIWEVVSTKPFTIIFLIGVMENGVIPATAQTSAENIAGLLSTHYGTSDRSNYKVLGTFDAPRTQHGDYRIKKSFNLLSWANKWLSDRDKKEFSELSPGYLEMGVSVIFLGEDSQVFTETHTHQADYYIDTSTPRRAFLN